VPRREERPLERPSVLLLGPEKDPLLDTVKAKLVSTDSVEVLRFTKDDILQRLEVDDHISQTGRAVVRWKLGGIELDSESVSGILNGIGHLRVDDFANYHVDDREYALAEMHAYLQFALSTFRNVVNPPRDGSVGGYTRSLIYQWQLVRASAQWRVPDHFYGFVGDLPFRVASSPQLIVNSNPYAVRNWVTGSPSTKINERAPHLFYVRPSGDPVLIFIVDEFYICIDLQTQAIFLVPEEIKSLSAFLRSHFRLRLCTVLYFLDSLGQWTFGSISPDISLEDVRDLPRDLLVEQIAMCLWRQTSP
jgi:hypothetical protein